MILSKKKYRIHYSWLTPLIFVIIQGCSITPLTSSNQQKEPTEFIKEQHKIFATNNPERVSRIGDFQLTVRMATSAEIPGDKYKETLFYPAHGATSLTLGVMAPPMYSSALVVSGVILIPLGTFLYTHEKKLYSSINNELTNVSMTSMIAQSIKQRLNAKFKDNEIPNLNVEVAIEAFGLSKSSSASPECLFIIGNMIFSKNNVAIKQEYLQITDINKSEDAPPPQCGTLERFGENDAQLVKDTLAEYAEVLAAMVTDRIVKEAKK